jgi:hypothetical protein
MYDSLAFYPRTPMKPALRAVLSIVLIAALALAVAASFRIARVNRASAAIPIYAGTREGGGRTRYFPHVIAWDDRSSARVQRVFALSHAMSLATIARHADATLSQRGWYLVTPDDLERIANPQVIVWQRDPDERLDLMQVWPIAGMTRTTRLYGGIFPADFLDAPMVIEWSWALGGARSPRPAPPPSPIVQRPPPPEPPQSR